MNTYAMFVRFEGKLACTDNNGWRYEGMTRELKEVTEFEQAVTSDIELTKNTELRTVAYAIKIL